MQTVLVLLLVGLAASRPEEGYSTRYENVDAQELADNVGLLKSYGNCYLGREPCTAEGSDLMETIADAIRTSCQKCSPKQRHLIRVVVKGFLTKLPELFAELAAKIDPKVVYKDAFEKFINGSD